VSGQLHAPAALTPGKETLYPLDRRLGEPQNRSGRRGEEKIFTLPGLKLLPLGRPVRSLSLYRLRYPGSLKTKLRGL
jgi:hypothetical protein